MIQPIIACGEFLKSYQSNFNFPSSSILPFYFNNYPMTCLLSNLLFTLGITSSANMAIDSSWHLYHTSRERHKARYQNLLFFSKLQYFICHRFRASINGAGIPMPCGVNFAGSSFDLPQRVPCNHCVQRSKQVIVIIIVSSARGAQIPQPLDQCRRHKYCEPLATFRGLE